MYIVSKSSQCYLGGGGSGYTIYLIFISPSHSALTIRNAECDCLKLKKRLCPLISIMFVLSTLFSPLLSASASRAEIDVKKQFNEFNVYSKDWVATAESACKRACVSKCNARKYFENSKR